jgi:hypothetical protein
MLDLLRITCAVGVVRKETAKKAPAAAESAPMLPSPNHTHTGILRRFLAGCRLTIWGLGLVDLRRCWFTFLASTLLTI